MIHPSQFTPSLPQNHQSLTLINSVSPFWFFPLNLPCTFPVAEWRTTHTWNIRFQTDANVCFCVVCFISSEGRCCRDFFLSLFIYSLSFLQAFGQQPIGRSPPREPQVIKKIAETLDERKSAGGSPQRCPVPAARTGSIVSWRLFQFRTNCGIPHPTPFSVFPFFWPSWIRFVLW